MHMESPERHSFGASLEGQESPLFNFLCTLSPIKPIKSLHASQSFTELSFPPPPAVFVTPRVHVKSSLHRSSFKSEQTTSLSHSNSIHNDDRGDGPRMGQRSTQSRDKSAGLLYASSVQIVEPQLAEPLEAESSNACRAVLTSVCISNAGSHSPVDVLSARDLDQGNSLRVEGTIAPRDMLYKLLDSDNKEEHMASLVGSSETLQGSQPLEPLNVVHLCSYGTVNNKDALDLDEEAADLVLLLSEVAGKTAPSEGWQKATSSTLSDMSNQHISSCLPSFYGNANEKAQNRQLDSFLMQMSTDCGDRKSANAYREQQEGAANKVNFPVQRGFRRRCLDSRVSEGHWKGKGMASLKLMQSNSYSKSQSTSTYLSDQDTHLAVLKERILATSDAINSDFIPVNAKTSKPRLPQGHLLNEAPADLDGQLHEIYPPPCGTFPSPPNIPSGIGLHLNSLTGSMPLLQSSRGVDDLSLAGSAVVGSQSRIQLADKHGVSSPLANFENSMQSEPIFEGDLAVSVVEKTEMMACEDHIISASESVACVGSFPTRATQLKEDASSAGVEKLPTHLDQERVLLSVGHCQIDCDGGQHSSTTQTAKNIRKRALTADILGDGCKRCNCKKSKCLKLYCECFAAGVFCIDSCSCHDCHNKPSFEDTVLETRQQIESRNPLAFAPKIMRAVANSPMPGEKSIEVTPASARHKKGCSCKKSKCLKKYCECYQAAVGCSQGCRCENCDNLYGRKEGSEGSEGKDIGEDLNGKEVMKEKMDTSDFCSEFEHVAQYRHHDLSPITPSFQHTGPVSSSTIHRSTTRRRFSNKGLQSPDTLLPSSKPPKTVLQPLRSSKAAKNSFEAYKIGRQLPSSPSHSPKSLKSGQFSPRWDGLGDICTLTPLPQAPLRPATPSASFVYGADTSPSLNVLPCGGPPSSGSDSVCNVNLTQCSSPTCHRASDSSATNYRTNTPTDLQSTPTTPIVNAPFCGTGLESPYEDSMFFCTKTGRSSEDAIPAILKGPEPACSSIFSLKSNSPKQKRVSPPHFVGSRITSQGRGQSPALRNGRKFTLQSVSSVPTYSAI